MMINKGRDQQNLRPFFQFYPINIAHFFLKLNLK